MAERTGKVVAVQTPEEGSKAPVKIDVLLDGKEKPNKVTAWGRIKLGEDWTANPAAQVQVGDYGTFIGETKEESFNGNSFTRFYAEDFRPQVQTANGTHIAANGNGHSAPTETKPDSRNASFALAYAKDIVLHMIDVGTVKEVADIEAAWFELAEAGHLWLSQTSS